MSLINSGNGIIGIDYSEMNRVKSNLKSARDRSTDLNRKINTVITKLQVDKGSSRIKMATDQLRDYSRQVTRMQSDMESTINKVDKAIRRFKEVDSACAARIRAVGGNESEKKSFFEEAEEGLVSIGGKIEGELGDVLEEGTKVFEGLTGFASEWMDKHPLAMDVIGAVVDVAAIVLTVAAITASAPALAIVGAVIGVVLAANSLIDEGTKIYNNLRNGSNAGFNAIESGFKEVLGNKVGEVAYEVVNIAGIVVSLPSALRGGVEILSGVKNIIKEGSLIEEGEKIFTTLKETTGEIGNSLKTIKQIITGEKSISLSVLDTGTGVRIPNVSVIDNDINSISKIEEVSGGENSLEGGSKADLLSTYKERIAQTPINNGKWTDVRGESTFISDNVEAGNILKEVGRDGVDYSNAIPDFSIVSHGEVKIEGMSIDRRINFKKADELLAEQLGKTTKEIVKMRKINNLTWHELNDMKTMQLVPTLINSKFGHLGGVSEVSKVIK